MAWLERYLSTFPGTVIAVTHDRYFLDNVAGWILELDWGGVSLKGTVFLLAGAEAETSHVRKGPKANAESHCPAS